MNSEREVEGALAISWLLGSLRLKLRCFLFFVSQLIHQLEFGEVSLGDAWISFSKTPGCLGRGRLLY